MRPGSLGLARRTAGAALSMLLGVQALVHALPAQGAELAARLDRDRIVLGETVTLVIQTNDPQQSLDGNFQPLEADFIVLDRRTETQMSIIGGRQSAVMRLLITLEPRKPGRVAIPALAFGALQTPSLQLTVDPPPEARPGELPKVFIETELDPAAGPHYVHAQFGLTVRVFYLAELTEAAITPPEPAPAAVRLLEEVPYQAERGGQRYRVLERHYAIFPERSGPLRIPGMKLSGRMVERRTDNLWQPAVRGRRIEVESEPVEIQVLPRPDAYAGDAWQPARALQLTQNISPGDSVTVGEPVTRTVIIDATGLEENMISEPAWPAVSAARIYPDQPQGITRDDGRWVLGHKEFRYAVVPEAAGELVLPPLTVHWWDTVNDRAAEAVLPEKRLRVLPSAAPVPPPAEPVAARPAVEAEAAPQSARAARATDRPWVAATLLFAALWLVTLGLHLRRASGSRVRHRLAQEQDGGEQAELAELRRACEAAHPAEARSGLQRWLRLHGPREAGGSVLAFANHCGDPALAHSLRELDAAGFSPGNGAAFDGPGLWRAFSAWRTRWLDDAPGEAKGVIDLYGLTERSARKA